MWFGIIQSPYNVACCSCSHQSNQWMLLYGSNHNKHADCYEVDTDNCSTCAIELADPRVKLALRI